MSPPNWQLRRSVGWPNGRRPVLFFFIIINFTSFALVEARSIFFFINFTSFALVFTHVSLFFTAGGPFYLFFY